jgi:dihydrolipoamide dehydrogenase
MDARDYFAKVIVETSTMKILGAHIIGPYASVLVQEIINIMYTPTLSAKPIIAGMHIYPPAQYHHVIEEHFGLPMK